jgi:hypothetical protein
MVMINIQPFLIPGRTSALVFRIPEAQHNTQMSASLAYDAKLKSVVLARN